MVNIGFHIFSLGLVDVFPLCSSCQLPVDFQFSKWCCCSINFLLFPSVHGLHKPKVMSFDVTIINCYADSRIIFLSRPQMCLGLFVSFAYPLTWQRFHLSY